jgi:hypothetical protein
MTLVPLIATFGIAFTVRLYTAKFVHPVWLDPTVMVYELVTLGETAVIAELAPLLHEYVSTPVPLAISVAVCPIQIADGAGVMVTVGREINVMDVTAVLLTQPAVLVPTTE